MVVRKSIGIIGAGPAGLAACATLRKIFDVTVFEKSNNVGGIWCREGEEKTGAYQSLRTNLPKEIMSFFGYEFEVLNCVEKDKGRSFVTADSVEKYLNDYSTTFELRKYVKFKTPVENVSLMDDKRWKVETGSEIYEFDYVVVCNGHYNEPFIPSCARKEIIKEINWKGLVFHGKYLDANEYFVDPDTKVEHSYKGKRIAVVGCRASGLDFVNILLKTAAEIHVCTKDYTPERNIAFEGLKKANILEHVFIHQGLTGLIPDSNRIKCAEGDEFEVDIVILATGYKFEYPFFDKSFNLVEKGKRVKNLYRQIQHRQYNSLFFAGLVTLVLPFPTFSAQAEWIKHRINLLEQKKTTNYFPTEKDDEFSADYYKERFAMSHLMTIEKNTGYAEETRKAFRYWETLLEDASLDKDYFVSNRKFREYIFGESMKNIVRLPGGGDAFREVIFPSFLEYST